MKVKRIIIVSLLMIATLSVLVSCAKENLSDTEKPVVVYYADGVKSENPPVGNYIYYVKGEDANKFYKWDYENNRIADYDEQKNYTVFGFSVSKIYGSMSDLKVDTEIKIGDKVGVKSFINDKKFGAGVWEIVENGLPAKGDQKVSNGLYAKIVPFDIDGKSIVTVDQFGTRCDGKNADNRYINMALQNDVDIVEFENDKYLQTDTISFYKSGITLDGKGAQIRNKYDKGVVNVDLEIKGSSEKPIKNITVQNLELYCSEEKGKGALYNVNGGNQITLVNSENATIKNCRLIIPEEGDEPRSRSSIWTNGYTKHLLIEDNYIFNYCDTGGGGGIWISTSADSFEDPAEDITVRNNRVIKNSCDEVFAVFIGYFKDILVENNYFETKDHFFVTDAMDGGGKNGIGIGVYDCETHIKNMKFLNNEVRLCLTNTAFIFSDSENIEVAGNKVYVREGLYGTGLKRVSGLNNLFRMIRMDGLTKENCNVKDLNVHDNYFEVNVGPVSGRNYDMMCFETGIASGSFKNNEFLINCRLNKILDDKIEFVGNKITVNGSLINKNIPEGNTLIVNE